MSNEYLDKKAIYAYNLAKEKKFFKKARAVIIDKNNIYLIKVTNKNGDVSYLLPGGGVDDGETPKSAAEREAFEEYGVKVKNGKYIARQYYSCELSLNGEKFKSNRVEYFYLFELDKSIKSADNFGLEGEFERENTIYEKITIPLSKIKSIDLKKFGKMNEKTYSNFLQMIK